MNALKWIDLLRIKDVFMHVPASELELTAVTRGVEVIFIKKDRQND